MNVHALEHDELLGYALTVFLFLNNASFFKYQNAFTIYFIMETKIRKVLKKVP